MAYRIRAEESVEEACRRVVIEQIDKALGEMNESDLDVHETLHQVRKRCKKIRGVLRLVRPAMRTYRVENVRFRDAARSIAGLRDSTSLIECVDALVEGEPSLSSSAVFKGVRSSLVERRRTIVEGADPGSSLEDVRAALLAGRDRASKWTLDERGFDSIRGGLKRTYRAGRDAMRKAAEEPSVSRVHEWRKRVKYHRSHLRLLRDAWPAVLGPWADEAKGLASILGDHHDLGILRGTLVAEPDRFGNTESLAPVLSIIDLRMARLQAAARPVGLRLFAESPGTFESRVSRLWKAWRVERRLRHAAGGH